MFARYLKPYAEFAFALLRVGCGLMFSFHGMQKVLGILSEHTPPVGSQIWIGGVIELVSGLLMAVGLFTSCAAFIASGTMAVAYVQFHWQFAGGGQFFPAVNKGELALVYSLLFLYFACRGAGPYSLDAKRRPRSL
ncbi:MAG TPA: DoxX family protein [Polyangiaceae bacterium]|jgi:putative oxidoreductase|nr:DoxX family protein [Polyangiaceae bacterium]